MVGFCSFQKNVGSAYISHNRFRGIFHAGIVPASACQVQNQIRSFHVLSYKAPVQDVALYKLHVLAKEAPERAVMPSMVYAHDFILFGEASQQTAAYVPSPARHEDFHFLACTLSATRTS